MNEQEFVKQFIEELDTSVKEYNIDSKLNSFIEWDSLGRMVITSWLNDNFNCKIKIEETVKASTIRDLYNKVKEL